jgi:hypothetical protein
MERGNTKHGPALDEQMQHEARGVVQGGVDSHTDDFRDPEPAGEDQPDATWEGGGTRNTPRSGGAPPGMTYDEVEGRSRLGRYIPRASLPGDRDDLIAGASELNAPDDVLNMLESLPHDETYETVAQVWEALGYHNEDVNRRT